MHASLQKLSDTAQPNASMIQYYQAYKCFYIDYVIFLWKLSLLPWNS